jgi:hypothetical protein
MNGQIQYDSRPHLTSPVTTPCGLDFEAELADKIAVEGLPDVACSEPLAPGDRCHVVTPVRFGRRVADPVGNLQLTSMSLKFRGTRDLSVPWTNVAGVARVNCDVRVSLLNNSRIMWFACQTANEAARVFVLARHLAMISSSSPPLMDTTALQRP